MMNSNFNIFRTIAALLVLTAIASIAIPQRGDPSNQSGTKNENKSSSPRTPSRAAAIARKRSKAALERRRREQAEKEAAASRAAQAAEQERLRREQADEQAAQTRAAQEAAEQERRRREQVEKELAETEAQAEAERERLRREQAAQTKAAQKQVEQERNRREQAERKEADERSRREQAERDAAAARAAQTRVVWLFTLNNNTRHPIDYQIFEKDTWGVVQTLPAGYSVTHTMVVEVITLKYDYKYEAGYQEQLFNLSLTPVVGHEPTESEKANAKAYVFGVNGDGDIGLYPKS